MGLEGSSRSVCEEAVQEGAQEKGMRNTSLLL